MINFLFQKTRKFAILIAFLFFYVSTIAQTSVKVSGYIKDKKSGEDLPFAYIESNISGVGALSNEYGYYVVEIPKNKEITLSFSYTGYSTITKKFHLDSDTSFYALLVESNSSLDEVTVSANRKTADEKEVSSSRMSLIKLQTKQIKTLPSIGGEVDVLKVVQLLPGVSRGVEGGTGMFVRGGDADQNLILLDEAIVYNVGHLFGFFSVFNPDAIKDLSLTKGAFPAYYGGRLSSVLDIRMNEGNINKFSVRGGIGLLSSRLTVEGPIIKDKISFLISGRRTYIDRVFALVNQKLPYYFYDFNAKINYIISDKDRIYFSSYIGDDVLKTQRTVDADSSSSEQGVFGFGFNLGNSTQTLRWNHLFSKKLFSNLSLIHTQFKYNVNGSFLDNNLVIKSQIRDLGIKADLHYFKTNKELIRFGVHIINHNFRPNVISTKGEISAFLASQKGELLSTLEFSPYIHYHRDIDKLTAFDLGFRLSSSAVKGAIYVGPEPRIALKRNISKHAALKMSYSRMYQYMHRVSSSTVALPTDLWYPITKSIKPQNADQVAIGYHLFVPKIKSLITIEAYHKWMRNLIEYEEGTNLVLNNNFEESLLQGKGRAYGLEFLIKKSIGKLNGWMGYTLSWSNRRFDKLNGGKTFFAKYDRRHDISLVANYDINKRHTLSVVWVFSNGNRFTPMIGQYFQPNASLTGIEIIPVYSSRNEVSMNTSHRLDINWVIKNKKKRRFSYEWFIGGYNIYNRATPFTIRIVADDKGGYKYTQPGLFGFIPSIAFNFNF